MARDQRTKAELLDENVGLWEALEQLRDRLGKLSEPDRIRLERDDERERRLELETELDMMTSELLEERTLRRTYSSEVDFLRELLRRLNPTTEEVLEHGA